MCALRFFFVIERPTPSSTRPDTLFPYTSLFRSRIRPEVPVTRADAAVAFSALHMAHLTGWYAETRPLGPAGGSHFLSFNFGIPTAAHDDAASFGIFRRILSAARAVAADCTNLSLEKVRQAYRASSGELRSEERRVGNECVSTRRSRLCP